jgi:hypothetical protein
VGALYARVAQPGRIMPAAAEAPNFSKLRRSMLCEFILSRVCEMDQSRESRSLRLHKRAFKLSDLFDRALRIPNANTAVGAAGREPSTVTEQSELG